MKIFPFTKSQIKHFEYEMKKAGGFYELMYIKQAIILKNGLRIIAIKYNTETYRKKYIKGAYKELQSFYDCDIPILFWIELYVAQFTNLRKFK